MKIKDILIISGIILIIVVGIVSINYFLIKPKITYFGFTWHPQIDEIPIYDDLGANMFRHPAGLSTIISPECTREGCFNYLDKTIHELQKNDMNSLITISWGGIFNKDSTNFCDNDVWKEKKKIYVDMSYNITKEMVMRGLSGLHYEIMNEANYFNWCNDSQYTELFIESSKAIKMADPKAKVLVSGVGTHSNELLFWFNNLYKYGAKEHFDIMNIHPYCYDSNVYKWINGTSSKTCYEYENINHVRRIMNNYGDKNKKIWITETGLSTEGCGKENGKYYYFIDGKKIYGDTCPQVGESYVQQKEEKQKLVMEAIGDWIEKNNNYLKIDALLWYNFRDDSRDLSWSESNFGIIRRDLTKKPSYYTFKKIAKGDNF